MTIEPRTTELLLKNIHSKLVILGLVLILFGQLVSSVLFKVDVGNLLANLGALILVTGSIQWLFDTYIRTELFRDVANATLKNVNVSRSGIVDVLENSRTCNHNEAILRSDELIVGRNWSSRLLKQHINAFDKRVVSGHPVTFLILDPQSPSLEFLKNTLGMPNNIAGSIEEYLHLIDGLIKRAPNTNVVRVLKCPRMLHYSFVCTEEAIWWTPRKSSPGIVEMPAFEVSRGTLLYEHFKKDIDNLVTECS